MLGVVCRVTDTTNFVSLEMSNIIANITITEKIIDVIRTDDYMLHIDKRIFYEIIPEKKCY